MNHTINDPQINKLKRYESLLIISGLGVVAFGVWSIIRTSIYFFFNPPDISDYLGEEETARMLAEGREQGISIVTEHMSGIMMAIMFIFLGIALIFRLYVGLSARAYGRGRERRGFYIVIVWIMAFFGLLIICLDISEFLGPWIDAIINNDPQKLDSYESSTDRAASVSIIVDITSFLVFLELGISSVMVKKLRKELGIQPKGNWKKRAKQPQELAEELKEELTNGLRDIIGE